MAGLGGGRRCTKHGVGRCTELYDGSGGVAAHVHGRPCVPRRGSRMREARVDEGPPLVAVRSRRGPAACLLFLTGEMIRPARRDGPRRSRLSVHVPALLQPCVLLILRKQPWPCGCLPGRNNFLPCSLLLGANIRTVHVQTNTYALPRWHVRTCYQQRDKIEPTPRYANA